MQKVVLVVTQLAVQVVMQLAVPVVVQRLEVQGVMRPEKVGSKETSTTARRCTWQMMCSLKGWLTW